jgi:hypothetical protein
MMDPHIWLQPGTRLHMLVVRSDHVEVWTATNSRIGDSANWFGSYIAVYHNGDVISVTRNEASEDRFYIQRKAQ